jgi:hypothetical protein
MPEPAPAKRVAASWPITVSLTGTPNPSTTNAGIDDTIVFRVNPPPAIYLLTYDPDGTPANIFANETGYSVYLVAGANSPLQFNTNVVKAGDTCTFVASSTPAGARTAASDQGELVGVKGFINITA